MPGFAVLDQAGTEVGRAVHDGSGWRCTSPGVQSMVDATRAAGATDEQVLAYYADWSNGYLRTRPVDALKGHPHPGQRYTHGWVPVAGTAAAVLPSQDLGTSRRRIPFVFDTAELHSDYRPGQWQGVPGDLVAAARARQIFEVEAGYREARKRNAYPGFVEPFPDDESLTAVAHEMAQHEADRLGGSVLYTNGPHQIRVFSNDRRVKALEIADAVDELMATHPLETLRLGVSDTMPTNARGEQARGEHVRGSRGDMMIAAALFHDEHEYLHDEKKMPAARTVTALRYVLAHEWGHALDAEDRQGIGELAKQPGMSTYGQTTWEEAHAEAFAEWYLTGGQTTNPAARAYADRYGWAIR